MITVIGGIMKKVILVVLSLGALLSTPAMAAWCEAYTTCNDGRQIWCRSEGASCTWQEQRGVAVTCVGYDLPYYQGEAHTSESTCY